MEGEEGTPRRRQRERGASPPPEEVKKPKLDYVEPGEESRDLREEPAAESGDRMWETDVGTQDAREQPDEVGLMDLSEDVLLCVLKCVTSARDLKALGFTCKRLARLVGDRSLWSRMDARSHTVSRRQLAWFLTHGANETTNSIAVRGHALEAKGCLGRLNCKRKWYQPPTSEAPPPPYRSTSSVSVSKSAEGSQNDSIAPLPSTSKNTEGSPQDFTMPSPSTSNSLEGSPQKGGTASTVSTSKTTVGPPQESSTSSPSASKTSEVVALEVSPLQIEVASTSSTADGSPQNEVTSASTSSCTGVSPQEDLNSPSTSRSARGNNTSPPPLSPRNGECPVPGHQVFRRPGAGPGQPRCCRHPLHRNLPIRQLPNFTTTLDWPDIPMDLDEEPSESVSCPGPKWTFSAPMMTWISEHCPRLTELRLEYCNIDCAVTHISHLPPKLTLLSLAGTRLYNLPVTQSFLLRVANHLPQLEVLDVSDCNWLEPAALMPLSKLLALHTLLAARCPQLSECVAYASLACRYGFRQLKVLELRGTPVGDSEVSAFGWLPNLEELYLEPPLPEEELKQHCHYTDDPVTEQRDMDDWELMEPEYFSFLAHAIDLEVDQMASDVQYPCRTVTDKRKYFRRFRLNNPMIRPGGNIPHRNQNQARSCENISQNHPSSRNSTESSQNDESSPQCGDNSSQTDESSSQSGRSGSQSGGSGSQSGGSSSQSSGLSETISQSVGSITQRGTHKCGSVDENQTDSAPANEPVNLRQDNPGVPLQQRIMQRKYKAALIARSSLNQQFKDALNEFGHPDVGPSSPGVGTAQNSEKGGDQADVSNVPRNLRQDNPDNMPRQRNQQRLNDDYMAQSEQLLQFRDALCDLSREQGPPAPKLLKSKKEPKPEAQASTSNYSNLDQTPSTSRMDIDDPPSTSSNTNTEKKPSQENENTVTDATNNGSDSDDNGDNDKQNKRSKSENRDHVNDSPPFSNEVNHRIEHRNGAQRRQVDPRSRAEIELFQRVEQLSEEIDLQIAETLHANGEDPATARDGMNRENDPNITPWARVQRDLINRAERLAEVNERLAENGHINEQRRALDLRMREEMERNNEANVPNDNVRDRLPRVLIQRAERFNDRIRHHIAEFAAQRNEERENNNERNRDGRVHIICVNVQRPRNEMLNVFMNEQAQRAQVENNVPNGPNFVMVGNANELERYEVMQFMRFPLFRNRNQDPNIVSLVTDAAINRFGYSEAPEFVNYVHIGANGAMRAGFPPLVNAQRPKKARLRVLVVRGYSGITNHSLVHLATAAPDLRLLDVTGTKVTEEGVQSFKNLRPDCEVKYTKKEN